MKTIRPYNVNDMRVKAFFTVWYRDMLIHTNEELSPHEKALAYVKSLEEKPWAS